MRIGIVGSRTIRVLELSRYIHTTPEDVIISGGAEGVDMMAYHFAKKNGLQMIIHFPNYELDGKGAPLKRNQRIVDDSDVIFAFWDGKSRGTMNTVLKARRANKAVKLIQVKV